METENNNTDKILRTLFSDVKTESAPNGFAERIMQQIAATNKQKTLIQEKDSSWWGILLIAVSSLAIVFAMLYFLFPDSIVFPEINWAENFNAFANSLKITPPSFLLSPLTIAIGTASILFFILERTLHYHFRSRKEQLI